MSHVGNVDWHLIMYDPGIALMLYCWLKVKALISRDEKALIFFLSSLTEHSAESLAAVCWIFV